MSSAAQPSLIRPPTSEPEASAAGGARPSTLAVVIQALRPRQWTKNLAVLAPLVFAKNLLDPHAVILALGAVASFCLLAGGVYVLNDWVDRDKDRLHPIKRTRPIAAGFLSGRGAATLTSICWLAGGLLAFRIRTEFGLLATAYLILQILYSVVLKRFVILDVVVIAIGFLVRVVGGGIAIDVPVSNWLYLCTLLLATFLGFAKRRHELSSLPEASSHRANLSDYSIPMLDQMIAVVAAACVVAYGLYTVSPDTVEHVGSDGLKFTVPFVLYGIFRYLYLLHKRDAGGSPERVLLTDGPFIANILLFMLVAGIVLYR